MAQEDKSLPGNHLCCDVPADPSSHSLVSFSRSSTNLVLTIRRSKCTQPCSQPVETSPDFGPAGGRDWLMASANLDKSIKYFLPSATWKQSADLALEDNISQELFCLTDSS